MNENVLIIGLGETGNPLKEIIKQKFEVEGLDLEPQAINSNISIMHICYPYNKENFVDTTIEYIEKFKPKLTIINSTVLPGTTDRIYQKISIPIAYNPIRRKHTKMKEDLLFYTKYVAGIDTVTTSKAVNHFKSAGFKTEKVSSPMALELAKFIFK